ncbi:MAG TPA: Uma2 family endonuclease [Terriglobia bacterium]|jgi:Uma2 family endonuclease
MSSERKDRLNPEEYLSLERKAAVRSEYLDGDMVAMSGESREHNLIITNFVAELRFRLKGRSCEVYASDMRPKVSATGLYTYPDISVVRGDAQFEDAEVDTLINPVVIAEVLSESTASYDRNAKFAHYRKIPSLVDYLLVAQHEPRIEHYVRQPEGPWRRSEIRKLDGILDLPSIQCSVPMLEIYDRLFHL